MKITNELLAAYAEGKVSQEEREAVRQYLVNHPEKLRTVMIMMDEYFDMNIDDDAEEVPQNNILALHDNEEQPYGLLMAAFAPMAAIAQNPIVKKRLKTIPKEKKEDNDDFLTRLNGLYDEILNH